MGLEAPAPPPRRATTAIQRIAELDAEFDRRSAAAVAKIRATRERRAAHDTKTCAEPCCAPGKEKTK